MTPMQEQYNQIKAENPDCIILFRLGDFYEVFDDDAVKASAILGITLTGRGKDDKRRPMAGIPHHALPNYLPKLVAEGLKVAIADQTEEAQPGKLVDRKVTRIITPGTIFDELSLNPSKNNYIASLLITQGDGKLIPKDRTCFFLSFADITTGELKSYVSTSAAEISTELAKISPAEILTNLITHTNTIYPKALVQLYSSELVIERAREVLNKQFNTTKIDHFFPRDLGEFVVQYLVISSAQLIAYISETQRKSLSHIKNIKHYSNASTMQLDSSTIKNLELFFSSEGAEENSLFQTLNRCQTPMGKRLLRRWLLSPLKNPREIGARLNRVDVYYKSSIFLNDVVSILKSITDIERSVGRIGAGSSNPKDLVALSFSLTNALQLFQIHSSHEENTSFSTYHEPIQEIIELINNTLDDEPAVVFGSGHVIREGNNAEIDRLRSLRSNAKKILVEMQQREIASTGINSLKISYNQVFGYYIEVSKTNLAKVPQSYIRKQTLANAERYITEELKTLESEILSAEEKLILLEKELFSNLLSQVAQSSEIILEVASKVAEIDVLSNFANLSRERRYCRPVISSSENKISNGRHPVIELGATNFMPNDTLFSFESNFHIITGPNMSGKSTYIRQVALIYLLAQIGCFVTADEFVFQPVERIFTRIGTADNLSRGESTFMVEMIETANILNNASEDSLIVLDEIGRGTSTYDGVAIAWSVVEHICKNIKAKTLFATHYHELMALDKSLTSVKNFTVSIDDSGDGIRFLHKIKPGSASRSYGVHVAKMAGVPNEVVERANEILQRFEIHSSEHPVSQKPRTPTKPRTIDPEQVGLW